jgi:DNA-binding MarR family transcriptional regulator
MIRSGIVEREVAHIDAALARTRSGNPCTTVSLLAERAQMTKQAMAELVRHLETHGYVVRGTRPHRPACQSLCCRLIAAVT